MTREARAAAVQDQAVDLDIANCYPTLLTWLLRREGLPVHDALARYTAISADGVLEGRQQMQQAVQQWGLYASVAITVGEIKTGFLSAMFGKHPREWQAEHGIPGAVTPAPTLLAFYEAAAEAQRVVMRTTVGRRTCAAIEARDPGIREQRLRRVGLYMVLAQLESSAIQLAEAVCSRHRRQWNVLAICFDGFLCWPADGQAPQHEDVRDLCLAVQGAWRRELHFDGLLVQKSFADPGRRMPLDLEQADDAGAAEQRHY
eukprot:gene6980-7769_t